MDTRSDVYSLGVLLYELLTGRTPFLKEVLLDAGTEAMRRILVEQARRKLRLKRGGRATHVPLEGLDLASATGPEGLLRVHEVLERLAAENPLKAELIKLRFFVGLRIPEAAEILGLSPSTAKRHWTFARAWLISAFGDPP